MVGKGDFSLASPKKASLGRGAVPSTPHGVFYSPGPLGKGHLKVSQILSQKLVAGGAGEEGRGFLRTGRPCFYI